MKYVNFLIILLVSLELKSQNYTQYIDPMIGTGGHGHTFPGPTRPFGMVQLSPDTRIDGSWDGCSGYHYDDSIIYGFSHTHLSGTGCSDYGDFAFMPYFSKIDNNTPIDTLYYHGVKYSHKNEIAKAGYYNVKLNSGVQVELSVTPRAGIQSYSVSENGFLTVYLNLKHRDQLLEGEITEQDAVNFYGKRISKAWAERQELYFHSRISKLPIRTEILKDSTKAYGMILHFQMKVGERLQIMTAISSVDAEGALKNLEKEMPSFDFEAYKISANAAWNKEMQVLKAYGGKETDKIKFYTALYHCFIHPNIAQDVDDRYRGRDNKIHSNEKLGDYFTVFSLWDTYRSLHPLFNIVQRENNMDMIQTMITQYRQGGRLPVWELSSNETNCMIGYHAVSVMWDAFHKGVTNFSKRDLFESMKSIANENSAGLNSYKKYGYVRVDDDAESVSKTLEYAYNDWCIAQMARNLGEWKDFDSFSKRSKNWINVYDPETGWMRPRKNSSQMKNFSPYQVNNHFTEANSFQYSFYVPHDLIEYKRMIGGDQALDKKLDALFSAKNKTEGREQADITGLIGQYAHGNEPSHHIAWLYSDRKKRNDLIKFIRDSFYTTRPDGYIGNEDCGAMSAWFVWAAMGMYPVCPGSKEVATCEGLFDSVVIKSEVWTIPRDKYDTSQFYYIKEGYANGMRISGVEHSQPYILPSDQIFRGVQYIKMAGLPNIFYRINNGTNVPYKDSIRLDQSCKISFYGVDKTYISKTQEAQFYRLPEDREVQLLSKYNPQYDAGGAMGLVDGVLGDENWRKGYWQGFQAQDFEANIIFKEKRSISNISMRFLQDQRSWIFLPKSYEIHISDDGKNYKKIKTGLISESKQDDKVLVHKTAVGIDPIKTKYVKVIAKNYGKLQSWHQGAGGDAFIFIDEIEIK